MPLCYEIGVKITFNLNKTMCFYQPLVSQTGEPSKLSYLSPLFLYSCKAPLSNNPKNPEGWQADAD